MKNLQLPAATLETEGWTIKFKYVNNTEEDSQHANDGRMDFSPSSDHANKFVFYPVSDLFTAHWYYIDVSNLCIGWQRNCHTLPNIPCRSVFALLCAVYIVPQHTNGSSQFHMVSKWGRITSWSICKLVDVCFVSYRQFRAQDQSDMRIIILFCGNSELTSLFFQSYQISRDQEKNLFCSSQLVPLS